MAVEQRDLPRGWVWTTIGDICDTIMGQSPPSNSYNTDGLGLPFYQGKAEFGSLYPTPVKWCSDPIKIAEADDVLMSIRAPVGPTNLCRESSCIGRGLASLRPRQGILSKYVLYAIRDNEEVIAGQATGTTFAAISGDVLRSSSIPLAPLNEQHRIVSQIETLLTHIDAGVQVLKHAQARLKRYKASVLQAAVEGRLVPTEAEVAEAEGREYEPASALLERVREQRRQKFIEAQRQTLQAQVDMIASTNMGVTPMVLLTAWLQEMILLDVDIAQPDLVNDLRENFLATVTPELSHDEATTQWTTWHKWAIVQMQAKEIASQVLMNPRDVTVSRTQTSLGGMLGELSAQSRLSTDSLAELRQRWLIEPAEVKWREAEERLAKPDVANLPELPEGWVWTTIEQIGQVSGGITNSRYAVAEQPRDHKMMT